MNTYILNQNSKKEVVFIQHHCNRCAKELDALDRQLGFTIHKNIGYGSKYDLGEINLNLCCKCFDEIMDIIRPMCAEDPIKENAYQLNSCK